jgi:hypothetical protein
MLPSQLCNQLPNIINQQLNSRLTSIPQTIALTQILSVASGAFGLDQLVGGGGQCPASCGASGTAGVSAAAPKSQKLPAPVAPPLSSQPREFLKSLRVWEF